MMDLTTTRARAWALTRADGVVMGFTDHDRDLSFDGITFRAGTGMTASAIAYGDRIDLYTWAGLGLIIAGVAIGTLGDALGVAWGRRNVPPA